MSRTQELSVVVLMVAVIASSFGVVSTRHHVRMAFMHSEKLLKERDELNLRWESLQLELGALRTEGRIEAIARNQLGMKVPARDEIVNLIVENRRDLDTRL